MAQVTGVRDVAPGHEMAPARVVRLANDIAAQFPHQPDDVAARDIAAHITSFWEPRMTAALLAVAGGQEAGLVPRAEAAARLLAGRP